MEGEGGRGSWALLGREGLNRKLGVDCMACFWILTFCCVFFIAGLVDMRAGLVWLLQEFWTWTAS